MFHNTSTVSACNTVKNTVSFKISHLHGKISLTSGLSKVVGFQRKNLHLLHDLNQLPCWAIHQIHHQKRWQNQLPTAITKPPTSQLCDNPVTFFIIVQYFRDPAVLDELDLDEKTKSTLLSNIMRRLTPQAVKIRADIEVSCYAYDGIDAVKNSLLEGLKCSSEDVPIKVSIDL